MKIICVYSFAHLDMVVLVSWTLAGDSIRLAYNHQNQSETIKFLERCWLRVLINMTQFRYEKKIVDLSQYIAIMFLCQFVVPQKLDLLKRILLRTVCTFPQSW